MICLHTQLNCNVGLSSVYGKSVVKKWGGRWAKMCDTRWSLQKVSKLQMYSPEHGENRYSHLSHKGPAFSFFKWKQKNCCCCSRYYLRLKEGKSTQDEAAFLSQPALSGELGRNRVGHTDLIPRDVGEDFLVIKLLRCFLSYKAHMEFCSDNLCPSDKNTVIFPKITISRLETSYVAKPAVESHRAHTSCLLEM